MTLRVWSVDSTDLFVGPADDALQIVRVTLVNTGPETLGPMPVTVQVTGDRVSTPRPAAVATMAYGAEATVDVPVRIGDAVPGRPRSVVVSVEAGFGKGELMDRHAAEVVAAEPGWTVFLVSHFHYDPVWWTTQAAYTATWDAYDRTGGKRAGFQHSAFPLIEAHLDLAARDPDYKFVLAELDYLKPFWNAHPERRDELRALLAAGRVELVGGMYNEPNTNLTSAELTARNALTGAGYQRDVLGGDPRTAWQLDTFGHDPQFPGMLAGAGLDASAWARGPFHQWGPRIGSGDAARMQFPSEFEWVSPSGRGLLTSYLPAHYSPGWMLDSAPTLDAAEQVVYQLYQDLKPVAATRNVLLPVGTDCTLPSRWLTEVARSWGARYAWPRIVVGLPREFFAAVRADAAERRVHLLPQTRDMNPVYTGKDVSYIDTKQAQRAAETVLADAEKLATLAAGVGAAYPAAALDKAWRLLVFGAHHDAITGSESDQVYLDLLGGWREAWELGRAVHGAALGRLAAEVATGPGPEARDGCLAVTVLNPLSWRRTDVASVRLPVGRDHPGWTLLDERGRTVPAELDGEPDGEPGQEPGGEAAAPVEGDPPGGAADPPVQPEGRREDEGEDAGGTAGARAGAGAARTGWVTLRFVAADVPALGWRTWWAVPSATGAGAARPPEPLAGARIESGRFLVEVDPDRGGAVGRLLDKRSGTELLRAGAVGNELLVYDEYPQHPVHGEGPWHLLPRGPGVSAADGPAVVTATASPVAQRLTVTRSSAAGFAYTQEITLWSGVDRVELRTHVDGWQGADKLLRVRFPVPVEGALPVAEVGNAVIARNFGLPDVDAAEHPWTLDNPAHDWFGLGATARVRLRRPGAAGSDGEPGAEGDADGGAGAPVAERAIGVAEVVLPDRGEDPGAVRALVVALARAGVTSTCTRAGGRRYGSLDVDSNLPDVRVAVGDPAANAFTTAVLAAADRGYSAELERQLTTAGTARVWVPARRPLTESWVPDADVRGELDLPVLIVAGAGAAATAAAVEELGADLADATVEVEQPAALAGATGRLDDRTVALLNRGIPGCCATTGGDLLLSLLRSCTGWPSGVWIDQPARATPDGSGFQLQHWSHTFEYAVAACDGDWRAGRLVHHGHEYNHPLTALALAPQAGSLPPTASLLTVEPPEVVLTALKPAEPPPSAGEPRGPGEVALRCYEASGRAAEATVRCHWPLTAARTADLLERPGAPLQVAADGAVRLGLDGAEVATLLASPAWPRQAAPGTGVVEPWARPEAAALGPRAEPAQPCYSRYWLHNKGPAPLGGQPVSVHVSPQRTAPDGPFAVRVTVASDAVAADHGGKVRVVVPDGWTAEPAEHAFDLPPGGSDGFGTTIAPPDGAAPGRWFVAAELADGDQTYEDVVRVDLGARDQDRDGDGDGDGAPGTGAGGVPRSGGLGWVTGGPPELVAELRTPVVAAAPGGRARLLVAVRNQAAGTIRGEAQLLSPYETWPLLTPWTAGFELASGAEGELAYDLAVPPGTRPGRWWALVKLMWFGRVHYTACAEVEVVAASP